MKTGLFLMLALAAASAIAVTMQIAWAHNWVPRYDGNKWAQQCLIPSPRSTPVTCCNHSRAYCVTACDLADTDNGWKNACRANCESAGAVCLQRVQPLPPTGNVPGTRPPATRD